MQITKFAGCTAEFENLTYIFLILLLQKNFKNLENLVQRSTKVSDQLLHTYVVTLKKVKSSTHSTLILFLANHQKSEVSEMVCFAIVACLDPALRRPRVTAVSRNSGQCLPKLNQKP